MQAEMVIFLILKKESMLKFLKIPKSCHDIFQDAMFWYFLYSAILTCSFPVPQNTC